MTQIIGTVIVFALYLRMSKTDLMSVAILRPDDIALVRQQVRRLVHH